jgi:hypothetical protein
VNKIVFLLFVSILSVGFAQQDGYWDKERAKEVIFLRDRIVIKTDDFPVGTTELNIQNYPLDDNQKIANSLVSLLKAVPTGISQGSAELFSCCLEFQEMIKAVMLFFVK